MALSVRRPIAVLAAAVALIGLGGALAPTATATPPSAAYRFWGYFQQTGGAWQFAQTGPDGTNPADGSVEGWRFATAGPTDTRYPRATPTFDDVCGDTDPVSGSKRVGVVIDYGRAVDGAEGAEPPAPRAACAVVPESGSGNDVLAAVAEVRIEEGLTCAIDSYPASGCGDAVDPLPEAATAPDEEVDLTGLVGDDTTSPTTEATAETDAGTDQPTTVAAAEQSDDGGLGTGAWVAIAAIVLAVLIGGAALLRRRGAGD